MGSNSLSPDAVAARQACRQIEPLVLPCWGRSSRHRRAAVRQRRRPWLLAALLLPCRCAGWNSFATQQQLYSFQDFYSDAQYGPDFGYYSTGRILHSDGPADNGSPEAEGEGGQDWFNSYTTLPMSLSPDFAHTLCDRVFTMWESMGRPTPFVLIEFGGGTGMLARDILRRSREAHSDFYEALVKYVIAERSRAMRGAQRKTGAEFVSAGKMEVLETDAREAARIRPYLDEVMGGRPVVGIILSNELLDEMDPVRLRLMWRVGRVPSARRCADCRSYREAHVIHRVDLPVLDALLQPSDSKVGTTAAEAARPSAQSVAWEGISLPCGLLKTPALAHAMAVVAADLPPAERGWCSPMLVCCLPFLLAVNHALQYSDAALEPARIEAHDEDGQTELGRLYRHHQQRTNGTVILSKERYRELRRLAQARGPEVERAFLIGGHPSLLPGRMHSEEVLLALSPARCKELKGWMRRNAERLSAAAHLRNHVAWIYDGDPSAANTAVHLKMVVRPGEAQFVEQTSQLLDNGFLVTLDYGSDADALAWQALIRPNHEGILVMDARDELLQECTEVSYLECPGLQDITTSVDFTEVAQAGKELGGWSVLAYGPIFLLELSFAQSLPGLAPSNDPLKLGHLVERAGGLRTTGLQAWYLKHEQDPWASFKILVQHRGTHGAQWSLGPLGMEWPLHASPRLFRSPSSCWRSDLSKPPMGALIAASAHRTLGNEALHAYTDLAALNDEPVGEGVRLHEGLRRAESTAERAVLLQHFQALLLHSHTPLAQIFDEQHSAQKQAYADTHLALLLVDYLQFLRPHEDCKVIQSDKIISEIRTIATTRRLHELYGDDHFNRVLSDLAESVFANPNSTLPGLGAHPPHVCLAERALRSHCETISPADVDDQEEITENADADEAGGAPDDAIMDDSAHLGAVPDGVIMDDYASRGASSDDEVPDEVASVAMFGADAAAVVEPVPENGSHDASSWNGNVHVHAAYDGADVLDKAQLLAAIMGEPTVRLGEDSQAVVGS